MASQPPSPITPSRRRPRSLRTISLDSHPHEFSSPYTNGMTNDTSISRRSSQKLQNFYDQASPTTSRPGSSRSFQSHTFQHRRKSSSRLSIGSNKSFGQADGGLGNLADELENALDDDYEDQGVSFLDGLREGREEPSGTPPSCYGEINDMHDTPPPLMRELNPHSFRAEKRKSRHQRVESKHVGSDYGPDSDQDEDGFPYSLSKRMREIESITRTSTNTEDTLSEGGGVIIRTTDALKNLAPQTNIETNLSRIITAYTSMATHRAHKARDLFSQAHSLSYGNILELPENVVDTLLSEIQTLSSTTSVSHQQTPLTSLGILASMTSDLAQHLRSLIDVLQESRISTNSASRKLKSVKDMVEEMRIEQELTATSMMLIHAGDWDRRCRERQAAATCREVIRGFAETWGLEMEDRPWNYERTHVTTI